MNSGGGRTSAGERRKRVDRRTKARMRRRPSKTRRGSPRGMTGAGSPASGDSAGNRNK